MIENLSMNGKLLTPVDDYKYLSPNEIEDSPWKGMNVVIKLLVELRGADEFSIQINRPNPNPAVIDDIIRFPSIPRSWKHRTIYLCVDNEEFAGVDPEPVTIVLTKDEKIEVLTKALEDCIDSLGCFADQMCESPGYVKVSIDDGNKALRKVR